MLSIFVDREDRSWAGFLAAVAAIEAICLGIIAFSMAGGHFMLPLDDSYIHLQYARMMARGLPLVYTPGAMPSGGMTSPLYVLLMTPVMVAGLAGVRGALASFALGAVLWTLLPLWTTRLVRIVASPEAARVAGLLVLANGHLLWNFLSGMETGVYTMLLLGAVLGMAGWWKHERDADRLLAIACLGLLPLARPEGILFVFLAILVVLLRRGLAPRVSIVPLVLCIIPFVLWLVILRIGTGDWRPAGLTIKGLSAQPYLTPADKLAAAATTLSAITTKFYSNVIPDIYYAQFKGDSWMPYVPTGLGVLAFLGAGFCLCGEYRSRRPGTGVFLALAWIGGLASLAASLLPFIHQQRYVAPYTVLAIALAAVALWRLGQLFQQHEDFFIRASGVALVLVSVPSVPWWMAEYGRNSRDIYSLLRVASFHTESDPGPIAITDAGVLSYYGNGLRYDLVGLCSPEFTRATANGEGSTLEALSRLPQQSRPRTLVSYPSWWSRNFPLKSPVYTCSIPRTSITSGTDLVEWPIDWDAIDRGSSAPILPGRKVFMEMDVADLQSERAAGYQREIGIYDADVHVWPQPLSPVGAFHVEAISVADPDSTGTLLMGSTGQAVDGGRTIRGESFDFAPVTPTPGRKTLYIRASVPPMGRFTPTAEHLALTLRSNTTGYTVEVPVAAQLGESVATCSVDLTDALDRAGGTGWHIALRGIPDGSAWTSYHYWITNEP